MGRKFLGNDFSDPIIACGFFFILRARFRQYSARHSTVGPACLGVRRGRGDDELFWGENSFFFRFCYVPADRRCRSEGSWDLPNAKRMMAGPISANLDSFVG